LETDYVIIHKSAHDLFIISHVLTLSSGLQRVHCILKQFRGIEREREKEREKVNVLLK